MEVNSMVKKLIDQINAERIKQNLTLRDLALKSGVSEKHICQINSGKTNPTLEIISRLAVALGIDLEIKQQSPAESA